MFKVVREIPWEDLRDQIRETTLLNQPDVLPYANADIELRELDSRRFDIGPLSYFWHMGLPPIQATTKYVLGGNLEFQDSLADDLSQQGLDQLSLSGGVVLKNTETHDRTILVPPIIEYTTTDGSYVLDGAHRIFSNYLYRQQHHEPYMFRGNVHGPAIDQVRFVEEVRYKAPDRKINAIFVTRPSYPSYAHPNPWGEVKVVDEVPANPADKKDYRFDWPGGYKKLYRDFSHLGSSGLRGA